jgi:hypothetical protein
MRTRRSRALRGFVVGAIVGLAVSVGLLGLAVLGIQIQQVNDIIFAPAGMFMLAIKGDNWTGNEPFVILALPLVATVGLHGLVCALLGAIASLVGFARS